MDPTWYEVTVKQDEIEVWFSDEIFEDNISDRWSLKGCLLPGVSTVIQYGKCHPDGKNFNHHIIFEVPGSTVAQRNAVVKMLHNVWEQHYQDCTGTNDELPKQPVFYFGGGFIKDSVMYTVGDDGPEIFSPRYKNGRCWPVQITEDDADIFVKLKSAQIALEVLCQWEMNENPTDRRREIEETSLELMRHIPVGIIEIAHKQLVGGK